jgi:hypothetical protein
MKKLIYICSVLLLALTSCVSSGLDELPVYNEAEITNFNLEHRFLVTNANGIQRLEVVGLGGAVTIDAATATITATPTIPAPTSTFKQNERRNVSLEKIVAYTKLSPAAKIEPLEGASVLGIPGNFTAERRYKVTAADGRTSKVWTIKVNPLPVINQFEGTYTESGTLVRGTNPTDILTGEVYLSSINANTVLAQAGTSVFNNPAILYRIQVNADNTVTIISEPSASVLITPQVGVPSTYNPTTKTFDLHYQYTTSALRKFDTKLVLKP